MHRYTVYIDEAGDEGFRFTRGSSEWFLLGAFLVETAKDLGTVKLLDEFRADVGMPATKVVHFSDLSGTRRANLIERVATSGARAFSVIIHKPTVASSSLPEKQRMYFYATRLLVERMSWYCRDNAPDPENCNIKMLFSRRPMTSYVDMRDYLIRLRDDGNTTIHWPAIDIPALDARWHGEFRGLQIADAVCGGFSWALRIDKRGQTEDRYARMLKPIVYRQYGSYRKYGLKFMPPIPAGLISEPRFAWVREAYPQ